ncbi:MAG: transaldolase family protein, partial [Rhizobium giardinii]
KLDRLSAITTIMANTGDLGADTIIMGASFRNTGQIEALAGCDRPTIASALMDALASEEGELAPRTLSRSEDRRQAAWDASIASSVGVALSDEARCALARYADGSLP